MTDPILSVDGLSVNLRSRRGVVHAVQDVSFTTAAGEIHGIVGESGCGKTTLLRSILGLLPTGAVVASGIVTVDGRQVLTPGIPTRNRSVPGVSIVFQEPMTALNPVMTIGDQIAEAPRLALGLSRRAARQRALELMAHVGIPDPERRYDNHPHQLSGGLRQRVLIAIALSSEPTVILCDEPTTALDVTIQDQILRLLRRIADDTGVAVVYVTHDLAVVAETCDRLAVMYAGRFVETGTVDEVFNRPRHAYTLGLLDAVPDVSRGREPLTAIPGAPPDLVAVAPGCPFRDRCSFVVDECAVEGTDLIVLGEKRATACIRHEVLPEPVALAGGGS